jgi:hypothetical protein
MTARSRPQWFSGYPTGTPKCPGAGGAAGASGLDGRAIRFFRSQSLVAAGDG